MSDYNEADDVTSDEMFYARFDEDDGVWILYDCKTESARYETLPEMRAFVTGLWRGQSIMGEVDLTCAIFNKHSVLIDTMVSKG